MAERGLGAIPRPLCIAAIARGEGGNDPSTARAHTDTHVRTLSTCPVSQRARAQDKPHTWNITKGYETSLQDMLASYVDGDNHWRFESSSIAMSSGGSTSFIHQRFACDLVQREGADRHHDQYLLGGDETQPFGEAAYTPGAEGLGG